MKLMKHIVAGLLGLALVAVAIATFTPAQAAGLYIGSGGAMVTAGTTTSAAGNWTNRLAGSTSQTNYTFVPLQGNNINVSWDFTMAAGGTTNQTIWFGYSNRPDSNYVTLLAPVAVTAAGTGIAVGQTNYTAFGGAGYFCVAVITNAFATGSHYMTNYNVYVNSR